MKNNKRSLFILKFLTEQTDERHLATITNINEYLRQYDLDANRETISDCIKELQDVGYDIFCVRSTQNQYYMRERPFSLAEVKLLVEAVQSSRFISEEQSLELVSKLADLVGSHKGEILKRHLYIESRAKTDNTGIMEYVDKIHQAITENRKIKFKYFEYNANKEKVLRYDGYTYTLSPCVLVWNNDMYYVVGIEGLVVIEPRVFGDSRGYFFESFSQREFEKEVGQVRFVQDNESKSSYGVVRGLHFQKPPHTQSKLVRVVKGRVLDVAVDLRRDSKTYGKYFSVELTEDNHLQLFIPKGFAHGFAVLSDEAVFQYKCDEFYAPESEGAIAWNDPDIGVDWQIPEDKVILSEKDKKHPSFKDLDVLF